MRRQITVIDRCYDAVIDRQLLEAGSRSPVYILGTVSSNACRTSLSREALERWHSFWNLMEALFIDSINRHIRATEQACVVERANFNNYGRKSLRSRCGMGAAFRAELSGYRPRKVTASELLGRPLGISESGYRHSHEYIRRSARDVLTFAAMALSFHHWLTLSDVAQRAAITTTFQLHRNPPARTGELSSSGTIIYLSRNITPRAILPLDYR